MMIRIRIINLVNRVIQHVERIPMEIEYENYAVQQIDRHLRCQIKVQKGNVVQLELVFRRNQTQQMPNTLEQTQQHELD